MPPTPDRKRQPAGLIVTLLVGAPLVVMLVWPQIFGAQLAPLVAQVVSFRAALVVLLGVGALLAVAVALLKSRWGVAAGIALVLGVASLGNGSVLLARGAESSMPRGEIVVMAWNTQGGATTPAEVARLVLATDADIVSLPETDASAAAEIALLLAAEGHRMTTDTAYGETGESWIPTSILIAESLGAYQVDQSAGSTPGLPSAVWRSVDGTGPTIVGAHPIPPLLERMAEWRAGLQWIAAQCNAPNVIVAGDLNATVDHLSGIGANSGALIGECQDAAVQANAGAVGTWPATIPAWLATPIDHVLVGSAWTVRGFTVVTSTAGGADHRPIVAVLDAR